MSLEEDLHDLLEDALIEPDPELVKSLGGKLSLKDLNLLWLWMDGERVQAANDALRTLRANP